MRPTWRAGKPASVRLAGHQRFLAALNFSSRPVPLALADDVRGPPSWNCPPTPDVSMAQST
jgi:hypothetical protein